MNLCVWAIEKNVFPEYVWGKKKAKERPIWMPWCTVLANCAFVYAYMVLNLLEVSGDTRTQKCPENPVHVQMILMMYGSYHLMMIFVTTPLGVSNLQRWILSFSIWIAD